MQRAGDFHLLLLGDGQLHHQIGGFEIGAEAIDHRLGLGGHLFALYQPAARQLAAEEDVLGHGKVRGQLHLLIDQSDACRQRIFWAFDMKRLAVDQDLAAGGDVGPGEDFHQGAFPGAVFAH